MAITQGDGPPPLRPSRGGEVIAFVERFLVHGEGDLEGEPVRLRDDQKLLAWRWYELDTDGGWWPERLYYEAPKGDGKTQLFAWFVIAELFLGEGWHGSRSNIVVSARSRLQAGQKIGGDLGEGIFGRCAQVLELSPLARYVTILEDRITLDGTASRVRLYPARASTVDGGLPTLFVADEVQDWGGQAAEAHQRNENSTTKRRAGRSMACSTPGARVGDPTVGWRLHDYGTKCAAGKIDDPRFLYCAHTASKSHNLKTVKGRRAAITEANPGLDKRRLDRLMRRFDEIPETDFRRFHLAQWQDASDASWLADKPGAWARCQAGDELVPGADIWAGVDVSLRNDSTSVAWCQALEGGRWVVRARLFEPGPNGVIDQSEVAAHLRDLAAAYNLRGVSYDPRFFEVTAQALGDEGLLMVEQPQHPSRMMPKCSTAWELIVGGGLAHDGDPILARHVNSSAKRFHEQGWTLSKAKSHDPIDACIALVLALHLAVTMASTKPAEAWVFSR